MPTRMDMFNSILSQLYVLFNEDSQYNDNDLQFAAFNQFYQWSSNKPSNIVLKINLDMLTPEFILESMISRYLLNLNNNIKKKKADKIRDSDTDNSLIIIKMSQHYIISYYLRLVTDIDKEDNYGSENVYLMNVVWYN